MTIVYRSMDRATLDKAYNNTKAVVDFPGVLTGFRERSAALYASIPFQVDLRYGPRPRQRFDLALSGIQNAPTWIFVHGGYWQTLSKEDFSFVASGPLGHGFNVALVEYTLAPDATMTGIVDEVGSLLDHVSSNRVKLGIGDGPVCLAGHSAGGHLALVHRGHPLVDAVLSISPLVDLEPISLCWLNEKLNLTGEELEQFSPLRRIAKGAPTTIAVGGAELPELVRHAVEYASAANKAGESVKYVSVCEATHFSVLEDLALSSGAIMTSLAESLVS